jgi:deoxyadenosine/deoxycytidine kinase
MVKTNLLFEAGFAIGDIPLTHLYNTSQINYKETIIQRITFSGKNSFETMYFNEFSLSEFVYFQFKHGFNRVTILKKVKPSLVLVSRMAWEIYKTRAACRGRLQNTE